ncbi:hypothetical protein HLPCO_001435 [Haloplasma contractile SSD-17B]|uniref:Uncharacterized protein n=1 Tax=Haloplasma contractile SSD-17B TaxID=1033810 RepID=U2FMS8_9MOLU|nr:hypothetical protein HLPCO_001435 [Haloplasma contractile SSD-17B]
MQNELFIYLYSSITILSNIEQIVKYFHDNYDSAKESLCIEIKDCKQKVVHSLLKIINLFIKD